MNGVECICSRVCDCQCPEPENGIAGVSNYCPIHNLYPKPDDNCEATNHWWDIDYISGSSANQLILNFESDI